MKIQANSLLKGTDRTIEFYNTSIVVKDGPNLGSSIKLGDLQIPYDSFFTSKMTLPSQGNYFPIMYGFLGTDITFLLIKVNYGGDNANPQTCAGQDKYIEYYFENTPQETRSICEMMILTGDKNHRIPQVYLYNPSVFDVTVEILVANIEPNVITGAILETSNNIYGLAFNDVLTDQIYGMSSTGSTQYEIIDINGSIQMVIPYNRIDILKIIGDTITISTTNEESIKLVFVSDFNAKQAFSRMNWVKKSTSTRYLTKNNIGLDTISPVITYNTPIPTGMTLSLPTTIKKSDLLTAFVYNVIDDRDGEINKNNIDLMIIKNINGEIFNEISEIGEYTLTFNISDIAGNTTSDNKSLSMN